MRFHTGMGMLLSHSDSNATLTTCCVLYCELLAKAHSRRVPCHDLSRRRCWHDYTRKYSRQRRVTSSVTSGLISMSGGHSRVKPSSAVLRVASTPILPP
jgi:hypothetical protein